MNLTVLLPCYKIMDVPAVTSLLQMQARVYQKGDNINVLVAHNYLVDQARQSLIEKALKMPEVDYILNLDSDHTYDPDTVYRIKDNLEKNNLSMLSAKYYVRNSVLPPRKIAMCKKTDSGYEQITPEREESGIKECDAVGNGFLLMKRDFLNRLHNKYKKLYDLSIYGEDVYFCELAKKEGFKVCYDADNIVGHLSLVVNK